MTRQRKSPTSAHTATKEWRELREQVLTGNDVCHYCGSPGADTLDHIIPAALGGQPTRENVRPAHRSCNSRAGAVLGNKLRAKGTKRTPTTADTTPESPFLGTHGSARNWEGARSAKIRSISPTYADGFALPRLSTPPAPDVAGSLGVEAIAAINASGILGDQQLRPWQAYALTRALEVRADGSLRWPICVITVGRQQGKSWLLRGLSWWRLHHDFGEPQTVLHVANKALTAREVWEPGARLAQAVYGSDAWVSQSQGREALRLPNGGRWLVQAANMHAGVGYSVNLAIIDEAWAVRRDVVESSITPTMSARIEPQLWLVSTAGDSGSDLLRAYREAALLDRDGTGEVLLLEWSAPPDAKWDDVETWKWASPEWDERRERFLRSRAQAMPEAKFRSQFNNQWVASADGWIPPSVWAACAHGRVPQPNRKDGPVIAVETDPNGSRITAVVAWQRGERVAVRAYMWESSDRLWAFIRKLGPARILLPPALAVHFPGDTRTVTVVGTRELRTYLPGVTRAITTRTLQYHSLDEYLTDHVLRAVAVGNPSDGSLSLSTARSSGPIQGARCLVWAVGEVLRPKGARPRVVSG